MRYFVTVYRKAKAWFWHQNSGHPVPLPRCCYIIALPSNSYCNSLSKECPQTITSERIVLFRVFLHVITACACLQCLFRLAFKRQALFHLTQSFGDDVSLEILYPSKAYTLSVLVSFSNRQTTLWAWLFLRERSRRPRVKSLTHLQNIWYLCLYLHPSVSRQRMMQSVSLVVTAHFPSYRIGRVPTSTGELIKNTPYPESSL